MEGWHFWFRSREERLSALLAHWAGPPAGHALDLGCGTGHLSRLLRARGHAVVSLDRRFEPCVDALAGSGLLPVQADATALPFASGSFTTVVALDLLEHVDDRSALAEIARVLAPQGLLFATVPALLGLWSHRDEAAGHLRRYARDELARCAREAGLEVAQLGYFQFLLLPLVWASRLLARAAPGACGLEERPSRVLNALLLALNRLENRLAGFVDWPAGSSLFLVARKP